MKGVFSTFKNIYGFLKKLPGRFKAACKRLREDPKRFWRDVVSSTFAEFAIINIYALASIFLGVCIVGVQDDNTWSEALRANVVQGEVLLVSLAMIGPLAYQVVADPPIKWNKFFQIVIVMFTLFGVCIYVVNKSSGNVDKEFILTTSFVMLLISLAINFLTTFNGQNIKKPAEKMRDETSVKLSGYADHIAGRK